jgi:hypothetical protein
MIRSLCTVRRTLRCVVDVLWSECREPVTSETRPDVKAHRVCVAVPSRCGERTVGDARGEDDVDPVRQPTADGHALIEHERSVNETLLLYA